MKPLPKRHWLWPILLVATIFWVSGTSNLATPSVDLKLPTDKIAHFLVFGLVATTLMRIPLVYRQGWRGVLLAVLITSGYGALDEFRQSFTPGRQVELADWVADTAGAILASVLYYRWTLYRHILEWRVFPLKKSN